MDEQQAPINGDRKPNPRFIIEVDLAAGTASWRIEGEGMPMATLVNSLEMAKVIFVQQQLLTMQARPAQQGILKANRLPPNLPPLPPRSGLGR